MDNHEITFSCCQSAPELSTISTDHLSLKFRLFPRTGCRITCRRKLPTRHGVPLQTPLHLLHLQLASMLDLRYLFANTGLILQKQVLRWQASIGDCVRCKPFLSIWNKLYHQLCCIRTRSVYLCIMQIFNYFFYCFFLWGGGDTNCRPAEESNGVRRPRQIRGPKIRANVPPKGPCWRHRVCHLGAIVVAWAARGRLGVGRI